MDKYVKIETGPFLEFLKKDTVFNSNRFTFDYLDVALRMWRLKKLKRRIVKSDLF